MNPRSPDSDERAAQALLHTPRHENVPWDNPANLVPAIQQSGAAPNEFPSSLDHQLRHPSRNTVRPFAVTGPHSNGFWAGMEQPQGSVPALPVSNQATRMQQRPSFISGYQVPDHPSGTQLRQNDALRMQQRSAPAIQQQQISTTSLPQTNQAARMQQQQRGASGFSIPYQAARMQPQQNSTFGFQASESRSVNEQHWNKNGAPRPPNPELLHQYQASMLRSSSRTPSGRASSGASTCSASASESSSRPSTSGGPDSDDQDDDNDPGTGRKRRARRHSRRPANSKPGDDKLQYYQGHPRILRALEGAKLKHEYYLLKHMFPLTLDSKRQAGESLDETKIVHGPIESGFTDTTDGMRKLIHDVGSTFRGAVATKLRPILVEATGLYPGARADGTTPSRDEKEQYARERVAFMQEDGAARWCHTGLVKKPLPSQAFDSPIIEAGVAALLWEGPDALIYKIPELKNITPPEVIPFIGTIVDHFFDEFRTGRAPEKGNPVKFEATKYRPKYTSLRAAFFKIYNTDAGKMLIDYNLRKWKEDAEYRSSAPLEQPELQPVIEGELSIEEATALIHERELARNSKPQSGNSVAAGRMAQVAGLGRGTVEGGVYGNRYGANGTNNGGMGSASGRAVASGGGMGSASGSAVASGGGMGSASGSAVASANGTAGGGAVGSGVDGGVVGGWEGIGDSAAAMTVSGGWDEYMTDYMREEYVGSEERYGGSEEGYGGGEGTGYTYRTG
ncbi:hypothetical protein HMN09_00560800 [Mycena chlorophos]|uniref:DUF6532 domain-containing protein n=1 Tax=Mycena chlorophos TaxID=658473 RepID=A0A8H6T8V5_MYCCL|nr:hypothetical protein HMN09_00560800 [Mycena chlorophos]